MNFPQQSSLIHEQIVHLWRNQVINRMIIHFQFSSNPFPAMQIIAELNCQLDFQLPAGVIKTDVLRTVFDSLKEDHRFEFCENFFYYRNSMIPNIGEALSPSLQLPSDHDSRQSTEPSPSRKYLHLFLLDDISFLATSM